MAVDDVIVAEGPEKNSVEPLLNACSRKDDVVTFLPSKQKEKGELNGHCRHHVNHDSGENDHLDLEMQQLSTPHTDDKMAAEELKEDGVQTEVRTTRKQWTLLAVLAATDFVTFAAITVLSPFFPSEAERKQASPKEYGAVIGIFELVALIVSNISIKAVSLVAPKYLMVGGIVLLGVATGLFGFIDRLPGGVLFVTAALLLRSLQGAGAGVIDVCSYMVATREMPHRVSTAIGVLEMAVGLGLTVGPAIGGVLYDAGGYGTPFFVLALLTLSLSPINFVSFPSQKGKAQARLRNIFRFLFDLEVFVCLVSITSGGAVLGLLTGVLEPHLRQFNMSATIIGIVTITTGSIFALTTPFWGHVCDRKANPYFLMFAGCVLCAIGFFFLGPFPYLPFDTLLWLVVVSLLFCGLGAASQSVCPYVLMLRSAKRVGLPDDIGTSALASALHITSSNLGCFIGPALGGLLIEYVGFRNGTAISLAGEALLLLLMIISWRLKR